MAVSRRHGGGARLDVRRRLGARPVRGATARRGRRAAACADSRAPRHAGRVPRKHLGHVSAGPASGAGRVRHRPPRARPDRRHLPELFHHRDRARGVHRRVALLRAHRRRQGVRGGGAQPPRRRADGHRSHARHCAFVRRGRRGRRTRRAAGGAQHLRALPDGSAARDPGLHRARHRRRRARRGTAPRRTAPRARRAAHRALCARAGGICAGRAARASHGVLALTSHRTGESQGVKSENPLALRATPLTRGAGAFIVLAGAAFFMGDYHNDVYRKLLLWVTLALGYNFLFGVCGQVAFSHFAFYGIGAYSIVIFLFQLHLPFPLAAICGIALCIVFALAVAIPSTRLEGFYLALVTLALGQLFIVVLNEGGTVTGGTGGIANYRLPEIYGLRLRGPWYTAVIALLVVATYAVLVRLDRSWFGRACRAVRDNPEAAAAMGVDVARTKVIAFTLTSVLAGIAGMVYAFVDNTVNTQIFGIENAFLLLFMVIVGGAGRHAGAVIGAVLLFLLPFWLSPLVGHHHALVFGVLVVAAILLEPRGLIGIYDRVADRYKGSPSR